MRWNFEKKKKKKSSRLFWSVITENQRLIREGDRGKQAGNRQKAQLSLRWELPRHPRMEMPVPRASVPPELRPRERPGNVSAIHRRDITCFWKWLDGFQMRTGSQEESPLSPSVGSQASRPGGQSGEVNARTHFSGSWNIYWKWESVSHAMPPWCLPHICIVWALIQNPLTSVA